MTIAGHVAQGLAEALCGLVIHQRKALGAPFLFGMGSAVLDMKTLQCTYNAPEYLIAHQAMIEISKKSMKKGKREAQPMPETTTASFSAISRRFSATATPSATLK